MWGLASSVMLLSTTFMSSCDEEDLKEEWYPEKVLVKCTGQSDMSTSAYNFTYDNKGRVIKSECSVFTEFASSNDTSHVTFDSDSFTRKTFYTSPFARDIVGNARGKLNSQGYITFFTDTLDIFNYLTDDKDTSIRTNEYQYDEFGHLTLCSIPYQNSRLFWENGNLVKIVEDSCTNILAYSKDPIYKNRGKLRFDPYPTYPDASYGVASEYMPIAYTTIFSNDSSVVYSLKYTFDEDGYPLTVDNGEYHRTFVWRNK